MKKYLLILVIFLNTSVNGQNIDFTSEYNQINWPLSLGVSGGITGDDGQYKRIAIYHGSSVSLQVGSNTPNISYSRLFINNLGNVGIGTITPDYKLTVNGAIRAFSNSSGDNFEIQSSRVFSDQIQGIKVVAASINTNSTVFGVAGIATSLNSSIDVRSAIGVYGEANDPTGDGLAGWFNGHLAYSGNFYHASDKRLKENVRDLPTSLDLVKKMKPKQYSFKKLGGFNFPVGERAGFLAQDMQELLPHLVGTGGLPLIRDAKDSIGTQDESEKYLMMDYVGLIPYIIKSIQEQQVIIEKQSFLIESLLLKDSLSSPTLAKDIPRIIKLYPNPASSQLDVEWFANGKPATISIYDKDGTTYWSFKADNTSATISLESFKNGVYIVALFINGAALDIKRFIVSK